MRKKRGEAKKGATEEERMKGRKKRERESKMKIQNDG